MIKAVVIPAKVWEDVMNDIVIPSERAALDPGSGGLRRTTLDSRFRGNDGTG